MSEPRPVKAPRPRARLSRWGLGFALLYAVIGVYLIHEDYVSHSGGFISLKGMLTDLVTAPISFPAEKFNLPFQPLNPWHAGLALFICALLIYAIVAGIESLIRGTRAA